MAERSRTVRAAVALILGIGFAVRAHRAFIDVDVPDETFHLLARFRPRDPRALLHAARGVFGAFDLVAALLAYRVASVLGLRAGARLFVLALLAWGPVAAQWGISGTTSIATAAIAAALLFSLKKGRSLGRVTLGLAVVMLPWILRPQATRIASSIGERLPLIWGVSSSFSSRAGRALAASAESIDVLVASLGIGSRAGAIAVGGALALTIGAPYRTRVALLRMTPFFSAIAVALVMHAAFWSLEIATLAPVALFGLALLLGIALDRALRSARSPLALLFALSAICLALRTEAPPEVVGGAIPPAHTACTKCGELAYFHPGLVTAIDADASLLEPMRDGRLLEALRARGIERLEVDPRFLHASILGPHPYEQLVAERGGWRIVRNDAEKDALIAIDRAAVHLSEHLGDGWVRTPEWVSSAGKSSELVVVLPIGRPVIQLELAAAEVDDHGTQPVDVFLGERKVATLAVDPAPRWYRVPLEGAAPGRQRLRLVYGASREHRENDVAWWRSANGVLVSAIRARNVRFGVTPRLPPEGPSLGDPEGAAALEKGWLGVERESVPPAVWASAKESVVVFSVDAPSAAHRLTIEAGPPPPDARGADQRVTVRAGTTTLGTLTLPAATISKHTLDIPRGTLVDGENRLVFQFDRVFTDGAVSRGAYVRTISLARLP
ncbi:MAG: hypothetical protein ACXVEF_01885 [Polyangiales bacterium]